MTAVLICLTDWDLWAQKNVHFLCLEHYETGKKCPEIVLKFTKIWSWNFTSCSCEPCYITQSQSHTRTPCTLFIIIHLTPKSWQIFAFYWITHTLISLIQQRLLWRRSCRLPVTCKYRYRHRPIHACKYRHIKYPQKHLHRPFTK